MKNPDPFSAGAEQKDFRGVVDFLLIRTMVEVSTGAPMELSSKGSLLATALFSEHCHALVQLGFRRLQALGLQSA